MLILINNDIPFNDNSYGFRRRFQVIEFNNEFSKRKGNRDVRIIEKLCTDENLQYIVFKALTYFSRVLRTQEFTEPECVRERTEKYMLANFPVAEFLTYFPEYKEMETPTDELREAYNKWADQSNHPHLEPVPFGRQILNKQLGFKPR